MHVPSLIAKKRDGLTLDDAEIRALIDRYGRGVLPEEQMSALAMAVLFQGLDDRETATWTDAMLRSGKVLDFRGLGRPVIDKHSTGGVGDKVSLVLAPIAAACGLTVPMVSGRGLGHTGGTLDKLEAIPGFTSQLDTAAFERVLRDVGCAIVGASADIAPADKRLYALRDVSGTVPSIPLIVASIMSKKLAEGLDALVLDVKVGRAAFMPTLPAARELARRMIAVGQAMGVKTAALITRMEEPLGHMVGNACEVEEALACLEGRGPAGLVALCIEQAALMIALGHDKDLGVARAEATAALSSGRAREVFERMVHAQGGRLGELPKATGETVLRADRDGYVVGIDGLAIAQTLVKLGAGRQVASDSIDPRIGVRLEVERGASVCPGAPLATLFHGASGPRVDLVADLGASFSLGDEPPAAVEVMLERM